jgi:hypothetical protein
MKMHSLGLAAIALAAVAAPMLAQSLGQGQAVVTVLSKKDGPLPPSILQQDLAVKVDGKNATVTTWKQYAPDSKIELVLLIDGGARSSLGRQTGDIEKFVNTLPPNVAAAIAYMQNGRSLFSGPLTLDHAAILKNLHLTGGTAGISASPYFCLSELAKHWPALDPAARREVVMITDGVDLYHPGFDPADPYVQEAITDATRAHLVVYSIYWSNRGFADARQAESAAGQSLLNQVAQATGGTSFYLGTGNPVSFEGYFDELIRRFRNQWDLGVETAYSGKPQVDELRLKLHAPGIEIDTPQKVLLDPAAAR